MLLAITIYALFTLISVAGTYLVVAPQRGRAAGLAGSALVLLFFAVLAVSLRLLAGGAGMP